MPGPRRRVTLTAVPGVCVGHAQTPHGATGVTVLLFEAGAPTVVDIRGGASGSFDTASLALDATFGRRWALFFAGGSLFGLDAARGIRRWILEHGGGTRAFDNPNPIVPISGAILFDLPRERIAPPDFARLGYRAASAASRSPVATGRVGAGSGATVGKYLGRRRADLGGVGSAAGRTRGFGAVGVVVVVNAVGALRDPSTGRWVAGPRDAQGQVVPPAFGPGSRGARTSTRGTTLVSVVTDARVDRSVLQRIAVYAHDGLARAVQPAHTATDGDTVFVTSTERVRSRGRERFPGERADQLGALTSQLVIEAILGVAGAPTGRSPAGAGRSPATPG